MRRVRWDEVLDSKLARPVFEVGRAGRADSAGRANTDKVMSTGWLAFGAMHSVFIGAGASGMLVAEGEWSAGWDALSVGALWGTRAGIAVCCAALFWMEFRWRGASESEMSKLSRRWRVWVRVAELVLLLSAKTFLFNCIVILIGGNWIGALVPASLGGLAVGWCALGIALKANRSVGFYCPERKIYQEVEPAVDQPGRRGDALLVDEGWLVRSETDSSVWKYFPWLSDAGGDRPAEPARREDRS